MRQQYGLRVQSEEFRQMSWDEFADLITGLNEQTPLVRVAMIRTETNPERLKDLTPEQRAMRSEWMRRRAKQRSQQEVDSFLSTIQKQFESNYTKED